MLLQRRAQDAGFTLTKIYHGYALTKLGGPTYGCVNLDEVARRLDEIEKLHRVKGIS
jgi:hypothetical protein